MAAEFGRDEWDEYARDYDALCHLRPYRRMLDDVERSLAKTQGAVLDAGCGTGNVLVRQKRHHGRIIGMDASAAMLQRAHDKCPMIRLQKADLDRALPFASSRFGVIVCVNTFYAVREPTRVLRQFYRILRSSGKLILVTPKHGYQNGLILKEHCGSNESDLFWKNMHRDSSRESLLVRKAVSDATLANSLIRIAHSNRRIAQERSFRFYRKSELLSLLERCGFHVLHIKSTYARQNLLLIATPTKRSKCRSV